MIKKGKLKSLYTKLLAHCPILSEFDFNISCTDISAFQTIHFKLLQTNLIKTRVPYIYIYIYIPYSFFVWAESIFNSELDSSMLIYNFNIPVSVIDFWQNEPSLSSLYIAGLICSIAVSNEQVNECRPIFIMHHDLHVHAGQFSFH